MLFMLCAIACYLIPVSRLQEDREVHALHLATCNILLKLSLIIADIPVGKEPR